MINIGKRFEEDIKKCIPDYVMTLRLKDSAQSYNHGTVSSFTTKNPYDFLMWDSKKRILYTLELKTVKGKSISFERIKEDHGEIHYHQIKGLEYASKFDGIIAGFIIQFREIESTLFINIDDFLLLMDSIEKKSFNINDLGKYNIKYTKIEQHIKRTRYSYDMDTFFSGGNRMKVNTKLNAAQFMILTQQIYEDFFDVTGEYSPAIGMLCTLRKFYDYCVTEHELTCTPEDTESVLNELLENEDILKAFSDAIYSFNEPCDYSFSFGNAFDEAQDMVKNKLKHPASKADALLDELTNMVKMLGTKFAGIDIESIANSLKDLDLSNINAEALVEAYQNSDRFKGNTASIVEAKNNRIRKLQEENVNLRNKLNVKNSQKGSVKNVLS